MKNIFAKMKVNLKNNPLTALFCGIELAMSGGIGYALLDFFKRFAWLVGWKLYVAAFGAAAIIYVILAVFTVLLGHDNAAFAYIRKVVKAIGGDKAVEVLDSANEEVMAKVAAEEAARAKAEEEAEAKKAAEEARKAEEQRIYEYALAQEEAKRAAAEKAMRDRLVNQYKAEFEAKEKAVEVVNNANSHNV